MHPSIVEITIEKCGPKSFKRSLLVSKIYDISVPLQEKMPLWPGDPGFKWTQTKSIERGDAANISNISLGSHTGTHIDAPVHFVQGAKTIDKVSVETLIGKATVFNIDSRQRITEDDLKKLDLEGVTRALFKTRNSNLWKTGEFTDDFVAFDIPAAQYLAGKGVQLVGIDYLSVGPFEDGVGVHQAFLENEIVVVESINLSEVPAGDYELICLPLRILGSEGAPARALLREF